MDYAIHIAILVLVYGTLALSLELLAGQTGILSVAQGAFFGIGAYTSALVTLRFGVEFPFGLVAAAVAGGVLSLSASLPSVRLSGDYLVLVTFAFQVIAFNVLNNWKNLTGGPLGLPGIPPPLVLGYAFGSPLSLLLLAGILGALACGALARIITSPFGRVLRAIREDELLAQSFGKDTTRCKIKAFATSAVLAAAAGSFYAHYVGFIDPSSFTVSESIFLISIVIIGGPGTLFGPLVGTVVLVVLPEALRWIGLPGSVVGNVRQILYGILLILFMIFRPRGALGRHDIGRA